MQIRLRRPSRNRQWVRLALLAGAIAVGVALIALFLTLIMPVLTRDTSRPPFVFETLLDPPLVEETRLIPVDPATARHINEARPFDRVTITPARAFVFSGDAEARGRAIACLAAAGWYEAGDDDAGQGSVMQVVMNRARHPAFAHSICGVVFQGSERSTGCQFTFTCDGALVRTPSPAAWKRATDRATAMLNGKVDRTVGYATHYHTDWVVPYWAPKLTKLTKVLTHIFYTWQGYWGTPPAFGRGSQAQEPTVAALARLSPAHTGPPDITPATSQPTPEIVPTIVTPPPPIVLDGVREKSLRGNVVRGQQSAADHRYFIELDKAAFPGNYATAALAICRGKQPCLVLGWRENGRMATALPLTDPQRAALSFLYVHDAQGGERVFWNCVQMQRPNKAQCLPDDAGALKALTG